MAKKTAFNSYAIREVVTMKLVFSVCFVLFFHSSKPQLIIIIIIINNIWSIIVDYFFLWWFDYSCINCQMLNERKKSQWKCVRSSFCYFSGIFDITKWKTFEIDWNLQMRKNQSTQIYFTTCKWVWKWFWKKNWLNWFFTVEDLFLEIITNIENILSHFLNSPPIVTIATAVDFAERDM